MHLYWRVIEELKFLGEIWTFQDPSLQRQFRRWLKKNEPVILLSMAEHSPGDSPVFKYGGIPRSLN